MKKKLLIIIPLVLLIGGGILFARKAKAKASTFKIDTAASGEMTVSLSASGEIKAEKDIALQFPASGLVSWVGVKKGDMVRQGQSIASLDTRDLKKKLEKSMNAYMTQRDDFEQTQANYQDEKDNALITDEIKRILNKTQNTLSSSVLDVELTDLAIRLSTIHSPFAGVVVSDVPYAGTNILATTSTIRIVDPKSVYFEALIDETDVPKVKIGDKVKVQLDAFPEQVFDAVVSKVDFGSSQSSGGGTVYKTYITFVGPTEQYRLGMNGDAEILLKSVDKALLVPLTSLIEKDSKTYVWKVDGGKAKKVEVKVENTNDDNAQIASGLNEGDKVISSNISLIKEGMAIKE